MLPSLSTVAIGLRARLCNCLLPASPAQFAGEQEVTIDELLKLPTTRRVRLRGRPRSALIDDLYEVVKSRGSSAPMRAAVTAATRAFAPFFSKHIPGNSACLASVICAPCTRFTPQLVPCLGW